MQYRMKKIIKMLVLTSAPLALNVGAAQAAGGPKGLRPLLNNFVQIDANGDGVLTTDELARHAAARFGKADSNRDGLLDPGEIEAALQARFEARRARAVEQAERQMPDPARITWMAQGVVLFRDTDGDGLLSAAEMAPRSGRMNRLINRLDRDGDGALSRAELAAARTAPGAQNPPDRP